MVRSWLDDKSALSRYEFGKYTQEKDVQAEICYSSRVDTGYNIMVYHLATWCLPALIPLASLASDNSSSSSPLLPLTASSYSRDIESCAVCLHKFHLRRPPSLAVFETDARNQCYDSRIEDEA